MPRHAQALRRSLSLLTLLTVLRLLALAAVVVPNLPATAAAPSTPAPSSPANRLTYLDEFSDPFQPSHQFPRLTTPQWIGEPGVDVVVTYGIDDMRGSAAYETYLRPLLERLKRIDGRAAVSIFANAPRADDPQIARWLQEGLSIEAHTLSHPCPILGQRSFTNAYDTYQGCIDLLNRIPGHTPVAFRTPCCDSINSPSPRLFAELMARTNQAGQFLRIDSSVAMVFTTNDPALPATAVLDADGRGRFAKYLPSPGFATFIENYPYPYIHTRTLWEMPFVVPSDWQSQHLQGNAHPRLLEDWLAALDLVALKQGMFNFVFHPNAWSAPTQHVAFVDQAVARLGPRIRFLTYPEVHTRLTRHLLDGQPLRAPDGSDNGVRLLDLNDDGHLDVMIANAQTRLARVWEPGPRRWRPLELPDTNAAPALHLRDARFGILAGGSVILLARTPAGDVSWRFAEGRWTADGTLCNGLELDGHPILTTAGDGRDRGVRLRDVDGDGACELIVGNEAQNAVFGWNAASRRWDRRPYGLPAGTSIVNARGEDNGLRWADFNGDGTDDVLFANEETQLLALMVPQLVLGFQPGWSREVLRAAHGVSPGLPPIVRAGPARNNGAWIARRTLFVQNEDVAHLPNISLRHSFEELLNGFQPPALEPKAALATIQVPEPFTVELVASEPLVQDPVYLDWDADGRLWVVEMRDYPLPVNNRPGAVIKRLEDTDGDGLPDRATVFADQLSFANGLLPWRDGLLISAAPDILHAADTDGDGRADRIRKLFTGFGVWNQQHLVNGFDYGLDNWIHGANGDSGGTVRSTLTGHSTSISGRDFRFHPDSGAFEAVAGQTQYGRHRDDWGHWFGNANPVWLWHYWLPEHYVRRNPRLAVDRLRRETATSPDAGRVHAIGRKQQRMNDVGTAGHVTSANSPTPYRDDLFGPEFARAVFISEPVHNAVHCEIVRPDGVSFTSTRWNDGAQREFLASSDPWFRPAGLRVGPDGALYLADMYRQYIEHPEWIPDDIKRRVNLRAGEERGRIYRVRPKDRPLRRIPRLDTLDTAGLVAALDHPNGWQRDAVQRLLVTRADPAAIAPLRRLALGARDARTRLQALCTLDGFALDAQPALDEPTLVAALEDAHPSVREHAVRLSESRLRGVSAPAAPAAATALVNALRRRLPDPEIRVRFQLALSLGEWNDPQSASALAEIATRDAGSSDVITAVMSSAARFPGELFAALARHPETLDRLQRLTSHLIQLSAASPASNGLVAIFARIAEAGPSGHAPWQLEGFARLIQELERSKAHPDALRQALELRPAFLASARRVATDAAAPAPQRVAALNLLGRDAAGEPADIRALAQLLSPGQPADLQTAALDRLGQLRSADAARALLNAWPNLPPARRDLLIETLLRRTAWIPLLLDQLETPQPPGTVGAGPAAHELGASARQQLLALTDPSLRDRARRLLPSPSNADPSKAALISRYLPAVRAAQGNADRGAALYGRHCAACHRLGGAGQGAAPDLASVVDRSPERMLVAILDPNRAVEDRYLNHVARLKDGEEWSGLLAGETSTSITLVSAGGTRTTLLRADVAELTTTRLSLMPEGFEQLLQPPDIADLLAHLDARATPPRAFPGNRPALVPAEPDGTVRLRARQAAIHGSGLVFESALRNLGFWNSPDARAGWTFEVPPGQGGPFEVWLHWACHDNEAGDGFRLEFGDSTLAGTVPGTGTWETYQARPIGRVSLAPGRHQAVIRAAPALRGFLMDLREIRLVPARPSVPQPIFTPPAEGQPD